MELHHIFIQLFRGIRLLRQVRVQLSISCFRMLIMGILQYNLIYRYGVHRRLEHQKLSIGLLISIMKEPTFFPLVAVLLLVLLVIQTISATGWPYDPSGLPGYAQGSKMWIWQYSGAPTSNPNPVIRLTLSFSGGSGGVSIQSSWLIFMSS